MQYLFLRESRLVAEAHGLEITAPYASQTRRALGFDAWTDITVAVPL